MPEPKDRFTPAQVGVLIEHLEKKLDTVLEIVQPIRDDVDVLKEDNKEIKERLARIEDAVRISVPDLNKRVGKLEAKVGV